MNSIQENLPFFTSLFDCLQANLGDNAELVLYDLTAPSGPVVADIRNGRISNGAAGFGKELLSQKNGIWPFQEYAKTYNAIHTTSSGSVLRCSAMCIYDESALPIGIRTFLPNRWIELNELRSSDISISMALFL